MSSFVRNGFCFSLFVLGFVFLGFAASARAHHGPGGAGGGVATQSAELLSPGQFAAGFRLDFSDFEKLSLAELQAKAAGQPDPFHALRSSRIETLSFDYGLSDEWQLGASIGYYHALGSREAEFDASVPTTDTFSQDPEGFTDLWLQGKWRFYRGERGNIALIGGAKVPVGRRHVLNSGGEEVELLETPSSGAYDFSLGVAWTQVVDETSGIDASLVYIRRGEHQDFKAGDRIEAGLALSRWLTEDHHAPTRWGVFGELLAVQLAKNEEDGTKEENSGGFTLFFSPGLRVQWNERTTFSIAPQIPIVQSLNGDQIDLNFKLMAGLTIRF